MTVWDAIGTGFEGGFVPRGKRRVGFGLDGQPLEVGGKEEKWRVQRMQDVLTELGPSVWKGRGAFRLLPEAVIHPKDKRQS